MRMISPISLARELIVPSLSPLFLWQAPHEFVFQGNKYPYFRHPHNRTWVNERIVEIALGLDMLHAYEGKRILEVGNVLSNYTEVVHDVLDKYETLPGVINEDIVNFRPKKKYDLILCISTLEHVGWDEEPREPEKVVKALQHMKTFLTPKGMIFMTTPFGYNSFLDKKLQHNELPVDEMYFLERKNWKNEWHQIKKDEVMKTQYSWFIMHANTIAVSYIYK